MQLTDSHHQYCMQILFLHSAMMNLLQYVEAHQLLLCKKHSYGIAADAVKNHLSKRHQIKEIQLHAVLEYVDSLSSL